MNCNNLYFDCSTIINMTIGAIIGFFLSYAAAYFYEKFTNRRKQNILLKEYKFLESREKKFDWQHWNVIDGKIADNPIPSFMKLKYLSNRTFNFEWIESENGRVEGDGKLIFEDEIYGKIHFFSINTIIYNSRDIFYRRITHQGLNYDAIFVNAKDQNSNYVLLRLS
jgi:hypothetical protein